MFHITPQGWIGSQTYDISEEGIPVAELRLARIRDRTTFTVEGVDYTVRREGLFRQTYLLETAGRTVARATTWFPFARGFEVMAGDRLLSFKRSLFLRTFTLWHGNLQVGRMRRDAWLQRTATADFPADIALPIQLFLIFLVLVTWRRARRAAK